MLPEPHGHRLADEGRAGDFAFPAPIDQRTFRRPWDHAQDLKQSRSACTEPGRTAELSIDKLDFMVSYTHYNQHVAATTETGVLTS